MARGGESEAADDDDGARGSARSVEQDRKARGDIPHIEKLQWTDRGVRRRIHELMSPRWAPPPPRRSTATAPSTRAALPSRSHPLRHPRDGLDGGPDGPDPWLAREGYARTSGSLRDAPTDAGEPRTPHTARATTHTRHRRPSSRRSPSTAQTVRPCVARPLKGGLDARCVRRHRAPRQARCPMRLSRGHGCSDPGPHLLQLVQFTSSATATPATLRNASGARSSSEFRGTR